MAATLETGDTALLTNILKEAQFTWQEKSIVNQVFKVWDMTGTPGLTAQIPVYGSITASTPGQTAEVSAGNPSTTSVSISAIEYGARVDVSDLLSETTARNMGSDVGIMIGNAIAEKVDTDAFALFTEGNISQNVGGSGTELTPSHILQAVYTLRGQSAPTDADGDYIAVLHPSQAYNIAKTLTGAAYSTSAAGNVLSATGNAMVSNSAFVGRLFNVKMFSSATLANDSVATDSLGAVFSPDAFAHVLKRPMKIERQRDASLRTTEYVGTTARYSGVVQSSYAVLVRGDKQIN